MKKVTLLLIVLSFTFLQANDWKISGNAGANLTQSFYSDDWQGSEQGNITWSIQTDFTAEKQFSPKFNNRNTLNLAYGQTHSQDNVSKDWNKPEKSTDKILFESLGTFTLDSYVNPFVGFKFESQFLDKSNDNDLKILNPATYTESFGISRDFIKNDDIFLNSRLAGAFKQLTNSHADENTNNGGIEFITEFRQMFSEDKVEFKSNINLYKALYSSIDKGDEWEAVDVNWENHLNVFVNKYLVVNLYVQWLYDKEIINKGQLKETLSLGLTYKLF